MQFETVKASTIANLESIIQGLKKIQLLEKLSFQFNTDDLQDINAIESLLNDIKTKINHKQYKYIYTFCLQNTSHANMVSNSYNTAKESKKAGRAYARLNKNFISPCLYVGSSKGLISRIKQHLGFGPKGTYAMHLYHWCKNLNLDITIDIYTFDKEVSKEAFQAFEDGAWSILKPMLGRQGKK